MPTPSYTFAMDPQVIETLKAGIEYERTRKSPPEGFPQLPDIPGGRYTDADFLRLERQHLWAKAWLYAGHVDELPEPGSLQAMAANRITDSCSCGTTTRRSARSTTPAGTGAVRWSERKPAACRVDWFVVFTAGLTSSPANWSASGIHGISSDLDKSCRSLLPVRCEQLGNWIFVNEDPHAPPLAEYLGPIHDYFSALPLETLRLVNHRTLEVNCNAKTFLETFLEVYHLKSTHPKTVDRFLDHRGTNIILWPQGHSLMLTPNRKAGWVDPGVKGMPEMAEATELEREASPSFNIFPNLVTPVAPTGLPFNLVWPISDRRSLLEVIWFAPDWGDGPAGCSLGRAPR